MIEVEVKFKIDDPKFFESAVKSFGAVKVSDQIEEDVYFQHPTVDFSKTDEALRIRLVNGEYILTYKGPKLDKKTKTREEINVKIDDGKTLAQILLKLGFKKFSEIKKHRTIYQFNNVEIAIDKVENLGNFVEFEITTDKKSDIPEKEKQIFDLARILNLKESASITKSYLELMLEKL